MIDSGVVETAMFGKQIQSNALNVAMAVFVTQHIKSIPYMSSTYTSVTQLADDVSSIKFTDLNKEQRTALLLLLGSENFQLLSKDAQAKITYKVDDETSKVFFDVKSGEEFTQEKQIPETFMNIPEGYTEEPIKPVDDTPYPKEHIHPNRVYLEHIIELMNPYMDLTDPTLEDYIVAAPVVLPQLRAEGKL